MFTYGYEADLTRIAAKLPAVHQSVRLVTSGARAHAAAATLLHKSITNTSFLNHSSSSHVVGRTAHAQMLMSATLDGDVQKIKALVLHRPTLVDVQDSALDEALQSTLTEYAVKVAIKDKVKQKQKRVAIRSKNKNKINFFFFTSIWFYTLC